MKSYSILLLIAMAVWGTGCEPSPDAFQTAIAQTQTFQYSIQTAISQTQQAQPAATFTPLPTILLTSIAAPTCSVNSAGVMAYFSSYGYTNFSEKGNEGGTSTRSLNELDSKGYGRIVDVQYDGSCVTQIRAVVVDHAPPTDTEAYTNAHFLTIVTGAGLTGPQENMMSGWLNGPGFSNLPDQAHKNGTATASIHLSSPGEYPFAEFTEDYYPSRIHVKYVIVFDGRGAVGSGALPNPPETQSSPCYPWDQVDKSFAGSTICVSGNVESKYDGSVPWWNYRYVIRFSREPNTFYIVDVNLGANSFYDYEHFNLSIGDCIDAEGIIGLDTGKTPFMKLGNKLVPCP